MQFDSCHGTTFLDFEDVKVPKQNLIGEEGTGAGGGGCGRGEVQTSKRARWVPFTHKSPQYVHTAIHLIHCKRQGLQIFDVQLQP